MSTSAVDGGFVGGSSRGRPQHAKKAPAPVVIGALATLALGIAIGSFIVTTNSTSTNNARLQSQMSSLRQQLATTNRKLATTNRRLTTTDRSLAGTRARVSSYGGQLSALKVSSDTTTLQGEVSRLVGWVSELSVCLPQLQQELSGLSIDTQERNGWLTSASLKSGPTLSSACTAASYPHQ
jgi:septal ring factor EnvC (AmiA/AmiB activator)